MRCPNDWDQPCPTSECARLKLMHRGHVSAISPSLTASGTRRIFCCRDCRTTVSETRDTVCFALRTPEEQVIMAVKRLLVRVDLAGISCVLGVTEETVVAWRRRAALKAQEIHTHLRRELPVTPVQRDERWHVVARQHARETDASGETRPDAAEGRPWVGARFAPTKARVRGIPACCSEACTCDRAALMACCHTVPTCPRTGTRGRPRQPVITPHPELVDGPWVHEQKQGKLVPISPRVRLGAERFTPCGLGISTALVERVHLTWRQALAPLVRNTSSFGKDRVQLRRRVVFFQAFDHVARPPMRWRTPLPRQACKRQGAIRLRWRERTPAMAAGLTEQVWPFRELLTATFEPLDSQSISG